MCGVCVADSVQSVDAKSSLDVKNGGGIGGER